MHDEVLMHEKIWKELKKPSTLLEWIPRSNSGFFSFQREKKNILELLKRRQDAQEQELKQNLKLEQDVEMEKLRKVRKSAKELQERNRKGRNEQHENYESAVQWLSFELLNTWTV